MIVNERAISFGSTMPDERVITANKIVIRNNFKRVTPSTEDTNNPAPQLDGYTFTEITYTPAEYISQLESQLTDLQLVVASLYEEE